MECKAIRVGPLQLDLLFNERRSVCGVRLPVTPPLKLTRRHLFSALDQLATFPIEPTNRSSFLRDVWRAISLIEPGSTLTYGQIAQRIGKPGAARAVGFACKSNPLLLAVPCHRVVAAHAIGGYSAGPAWKSLLLALEAEKAALHFGPGTL